MTLASAVTLPPPIPVLKCEIVTSTSKIRVTYENHVQRFANICATQNESTCQKMIFTNKHLSKLLKSKHTIIASYITYSFRILSGHVVLRAHAVTAKETRNIVAACGISTAVAPKLWGWNNFSPTGYMYNLLHTNKLMSNGRVYN